MLQTAVGASSRVCQAASGPEEGTPWADTGPEVPPGSGPGTKPSAGLGIPDSQMVRAQVRELGLRSWPGTAASGSAGEKNGQWVSASQVLQVQRTKGRRAEPSRDSPDLTHSASVNANCDSVWENSLAVPQNTTDRVAWYPSNTPGAQRTGREVNA